MFQSALRTGVLAFAASLAFGQAFDVASVKSSVPGTIGGRVQFLPGGRFSATNVPLNFLIQQVYGVRDFQILGAPNWMSVRYEIQAAGDASATEAMVKEMVKALLAERFQLKVHQETRELPVYAFIPVKAGVKLAVAKDNGKPRGSGSIAVFDSGWIQGTNVTMASVVQELSRSMDRPIVDKSNFTEAFDFRLQWTPDTDALADASTPSGCPAGFAEIQEELKLKPERMSCPSLFTAVQEQLGLKLDAQKAPIDVLVIDHVERPSAN